MKDMTKASNPIYLAFFLLVVCGVSTLVMAFTAVKTKDTILAAVAQETADSLKMILPEFDNNPAKETVKLKNGVTLYIAKKGGDIVGYAAEAKGKGYGGDVTGLVSFETDGTIRTVVVKSGHSETPGIGTKVTDRTVKRTISDLIHGVKPDPSKLVPNTALDAYKGQKPGNEKWTKEKAPAHSFVTGATRSSTAVCDLVWDAATAIRDYLAEQGLPTAPAAQPETVAQAPVETATPTETEVPTEAVTPVETEVPTESEVQSEADNLRPAAVPAAQQSQDEK